MKRCYRCGGDHDATYCPELKRDRQIEQQTEILKAQEKRALKEIKQNEENRRREAQAELEADPNYRSPTSRFVKFIFWCFIFIFAFGGFAKLTEVAPSLSALLVIGVIGFFAYRFFKKIKRTE